MNNFKQKLDDMMGDTSKQQASIAQGIRAKMQQQPLQKRKRSWQMPVVATAFVAVLMFFIASFNISSIISNEGRGIPYDPLEDLSEIGMQRDSDTFSTVDYDALLSYPVLEQLTELQYVDSETFEVDGKQYATVIERQPEIFKGSAYGIGDIVRTMTNTSSHLPIYNDEYYEIIAVPGDRVVLQGGKLTVNGKAVKSDLLEKYEDLHVTIAGGYDQLLNVREYVLLNRFPTKGSLQPLTINAVHKIYGKVVGVADIDQTQSIYLQDGFSANYLPEQFFDRYLYDLIFGDGTVAQQLTANGETFLHPSRISEYFLEAGYRTVYYVSENEAEIRYNYGTQRGKDHIFRMYKQSGSNVWQWGL